jgi:PAS domain S-box-containing protein
VGLVAVRLQRAGAFVPPGATVLGTTLSLLVIFGALLLLAHRLNRSDVERTRAEGELRQWKEFFDSASFGAVFVSPDDRLLWHNAAFAQMHGYEPGELGGHPIDTLFSPAVRAAMLSELRSIEQRGHNRFESEHLRKDGTTFPVVIDATAVRDAQARLVYRVAYVQDVTEEHSAREAQARLAALVDSAEDAIILTDPAGVVLSWNRAAERLYGHSAEEMLGNGTQCLYPADLASDRDRLVETLRRGEPIIGEQTERLRKDGTRVPISLTASPVRAADGTVRGISAISRDITEQRAAERALAAAREEVARVEAGALAVSEAIAGIPTTGLLHVLEVIAEEARSATDAAYAVVSLTQAADQPFEQWAVSGASEEHVSSLGEAMRGIGPLTIPIRDSEPERTSAVPELSGVRPNPAAIESFLGVPIEFRSQPRGSIYLANKPGPDGFSERDQRVVEALAGHIGSAIEIALLYEREAIERARLHAILRQLPEGVIVLDAHGVVAHENATALTYRTGSDPERPYDVRWPNGEIVSLEELPLWRASQHGETVTGLELRARMPSGELVPILVSAAPVSAEAGPVGAVAIFRDIRALKELERLREEWASVIAHDLRQPLNVISLGADVLGRDLTGKHALWAERIRSQARQLDQLIEDLLDVSRLEARRLELQPDLVRIEELVATALAGVPVLEGRIRVAIDPDAAQLFADPQRLLQVLGNLLSNAAKYGTPDREVLLEARRVDDQIRISISNHGPGIAPDEAPLLFERFTRTRAARKSTIQGIGLGLYICKGLIEAHAGRIWVESTPGLRTTFHFTLPVPERAPDALAGAREPASA